MSEIPDSDEESSVDDPHDKDDEDLDGDLRNCDQPLPSIEDSTPLEPEHGGLAESDLDFDAYDLTSNTKRMRSESTSRDSMVPFTGREEIVLLKSLRLKNQVKSCWNCFVHQYHCDPADGSNEDDWYRCRQCVILSLRCTPITKPETLESANRAREAVKLQAKTRQKHHRRQRRGVPHAEKCARCLRNQLACDGNQPCDTCVAVNGRCIRQEDEDKPKCLRCSRGLHCDRRTPCGTCLKAGVDCQYEAQQGLLIRVWPVKPISIAKLGSTPSDTCDWCRRNGNTGCNGDTPCQSCVRKACSAAYLARTPPTHSPRPCVYPNRELGCFERWTTKAYDFVDGKPQLKENWESFENTFRKRPSRLLSDEEDEGDLVPRRGKRPYTTQSVDDENDEDDLDLSKAPAPARRPGKKVTTSPFFLKPTTGPPDDNGEHPSTTGHVLMVDSALGYDSDDSFDPLTPDIPLDGDVLALLNDLRGSALTTEVDMLTLPDPQTYKEAMSAPDADKFREARDLELASLEKCGTFEIVPKLSTTQKPLTSR
jgi:hypothetical protein